MVESIHIGDEESFKLLMLKMFKSQMTCGVFVAAATPQIVQTEGRSYGTMRWPYGDRTVFFACRKGLQFV